MRGPLVIVSGPSGSGKSTVVDRVLREAGLPLQKSVSATTRSQRPGEQDGVDYHFWSRERFEQELAADAFLEWAEVFGNYYGTLKREVGPYQNLGHGVILEIDVQGAAQVRPLCPDHVSVFIRPPSMETLERRLRDRKTETEEAIQRRLAGARKEMEQAGDYDYTVINDDLDTAVSQLTAIIRQAY